MGLSQADMASYIQLPLRTYQRLEQEDRDLKASVLKKFAKVGVNISWLLTGEGPMFKVPDDAHINKVSEEGQVHQPVEPPPDLIAALTDPELQAILRLAKDLSPEDRRYILRLAQDKKRLQEMEEELKKLKNQLSA